MRNSSIEILRMLLMTMIVLWHFIVHGEGLSSHPYVIADVPIRHILILSILCYHVNTFVFISGYYGLRFTRLKFFSLLIIMFLCNALSIIVEMMIGTYEIHWNSWVNLFPFCSDVWWFMTNYLFLLLIAPILNIGIEQIPPKIYRQILLVLFVISVSGITFVIGVGNRESLLFVFLYLLGRYLHKYPSKWLKQRSWAAYVISLLVLFLFQYNHVMGKTMIEESMNLIPEYNNPFAIIAAVSFFFIFHKWKFTCSLANRLAANCLVAYLLTDGLLRHDFNKWIIACFGDSLFILIPVSFFTVIVICMMFDVIQQLIKPFIVSGVMFSRGLL